MHGKIERNDFGLFCKSIRNSRGETSRIMAKKLGYTTGHLWRIECGKVGVIANLRTKFLTSYELSEFELEALNKAIVSIGGVKDFKKNKQIKKLSIFCDNLIASRGEIFKDFAKNLDIDYHWLWCIVYNNDTVDNKIVLKIIDVYNLNELAIVDLYNSIKADNLAFVNKSKGLNEFGKFCCKLRIIKNETTQDMASNLNCNYTFLSKLTHGKYKVSNNFRLKLIDSYELSSVEIFELDKALEKDNSK